EAAGDQWITVSPGDLLCHIDRLHHIEAVRRDRHLPCPGPTRPAGYFELEGSQELGHAPYIDRNPEQALRPSHFSMDDATRLGVRVVVDDASRHRGPRDLGDQLRRAVGRVPRYVPADPLLMPHARLGAEDEPSCR